jgi:hypothetical protein
MLMAPEHPMITIFCGFFLTVTPFVDCFNPQARHLFLKKGKELFKIITAERP